MIFEHEIPAGSRLYFGESARIKRDLEYKASLILQSLGYEEMVTPLFSYHQQDSFSNNKDLIRLNDTKNYEVSLRADSTTDVMRIATKRLGRSVDLKKWFYIQPVYNYPTKERYQIGAEVIHGDFANIFNTVIKILDSFDIDVSFQIANIAIPHILNQNYKIPLEYLKSMEIEKLLAFDYDWLGRLISIQNIEDLDDLSIYPEDIALQLQKIKNVSKKIEHQDLIISPLYYAKLRYYDSLLLRAFDGNRVFSTGGEYKIENISACGFAIESDACIEKIMQKDSNNVK
jgi:histidyl-tRNA synthetase